MSNDTKKLNIIGKRGIIKNFTNVLVEFLFLFGSAGTLYRVKEPIFICYRFSYQIFYFSILMILIRNY